MILYVQEQRYLGSDWVDWAGLQLIKYSLLAIGHTTAKASATATA